MRPAAVIFPEVIPFKPPRLRLVLVDIFLVSFANESQSTCSNGAAFDAAQALASSSGYFPFVGRLLRNIWCTVKYAFCKAHCRKRITAIVWPPQILLWLWPSRCRVPCRFPASELATSVATTQQR